MSKAPEITSEVEAALRAAVNVVRDQQISRVDRLKDELRKLGHADEDIRLAIEFWACYVKTKKVLSRT
jgi:hypothetical protein